MIKHVNLELIAAVLDEHAIVSITDAAGNITYVNEKFIDISGYTRDELIGKNHRILKSGIHPPEFYQQMWDTLSSGRTWHGEVCNRRKSGTKYWVRSSIKPVLDSNGLPVQYISIRTDITDVKQTETQLTFFAQMIENTAEPVFLIDVEANYRLAYVNQAACKHWRASKEELLTWCIPDWDPNFDPARTTPLFAETLDKPGRIIETCHRLKDGRVVSVEVFSNARMIAGKPYLFGSFHDISERKKTEDALKLFKRICDTAEQAIGVADGEGRFLYSNRAHEHMVGYSYEELAGKHFSILLTEESLTQAQALVDATSKGKNWEGHIALKRSDGSEFVSASHISPLMGDDDKPQYLFNIFYDYTDELNRQQALHDAFDKAETANNAKSEFLSSMSHELRTPMNAIIGFGQLLEYDDTLSDENKDNVREILKAGNHLLALINEVLDLSKVELGHIDLSLEPVEVCSIVNECLDMIANIADRRSIHISHAGLKGAAVRADRTRLKQALLNLLSNAIKYNRAGGSVHVEVLPPGKDRRCTEQGRLCIRVTDTGPGISAARLSELFQPFNRLDAENSGIEGTGIGLTITRRIVEMMGGIVEVESEVGVGSTFWIELPIETMQDQTYVRERTLTNAQAPDMDEAPHTVLYIEDNPANLKLLARILGQRKHIRLLTAHTPELGIELAMTQHPEIILLDINMPGMNGYQVLEIFQADASLKSIPVIAVTANAMSRDIERGKAAGFIDYLTKPLDIVKFNVLLDRLLGS